HRHRAVDALLLPLVLAAALMSPAAATLAQSASPSGAVAIAADVFPGTLIEAMPAFVSGAPVTVQGPQEMDASAAKDGGLNADLQAILAAVGATTISVVTATDDDVLIVAVEIPDIDSTVLDDALAATLEADTAVGAARVDVIG